MLQTFTIYQPDGSVVTHEIEDGATLFAGSGSQCKVALSGPDAREIHCMISCVDSQLVIQDWNSGGKTRLNGQPISDEATLQPSDEVHFGEQVMLFGSATGDRRPACDNMARDVASGKSESRTEEVFDAAVATVQEADASAREPEHEIAQEDELLNELERVRADNAQLNKDLDDWGSFDCDSPEAGSSGFNSSSWADDAVDADPFAGGDYDLVRSEVEHLQVELNEKDQLILQLQQQLEAGGGLSDVDPVHADTERLVTRMEELLNELQSTDERVRSLEELLRASDEATQAEQEERQQLESWVDQIEQRVADRDEDAAAENKRLSQRVRDLVAQQKQNERVLERALEERRTDVADDNASTELLQTLGKQVQDLQTAWKEAQSENDRLANALKAYENIPDGSPEAYGLLQKKVMQLEIDLSRERAGIARERAELIRAKSEMEQQTREPVETDGVDAKLKAVRNQLRERHAEEAEEREARRAASLGGRIARLFSRVEARA